MESFAEDYTLATISTHTCMAHRWTQSLVIDAKNITTQSSIYENKSAAHTCIILGNILITVVIIFSRKPEQLIHTHSTWLGILLWDNSVFQSYFDHHLIIATSLWNHIINTGTGDYLSSNCSRVPNDSISLCKNLMDPLLIDDDQMKKGREPESCCYSC